MKKKNSFLWHTFYATALTVIIISCKPDLQEEKTTSGEFWKKQTTEQILDPWSEKAVHEESGIFYTFLNRAWNPYGGNVKYPGMISRHIFSYSAGYMMTGNKNYLDKATSIKNYLISKGWDKEHGGWYDALAADNDVLDDSKDLFHQIYAITGLSMYYFATQDSTALSYIEKTHSLIKEHAWDKEYKGLYRRLNRDLSVETSNKTVTSQIAPVSGYLLYMYQATKNNEYLEMAEKLTELILNKMTTNEYKYVQEKYDRQWNYIYEKQEDDTEINIGHNLELAWILLRLYEITENEKYLKEANEMWPKLKKYAYAEKNQAWYHRIGLEVPSLHTDATPWWIQAYGNMTMLYYYHRTGNEKHLQLFDKGARYWNDHFIDNEYGGTILSAYNTGKIQKGQKAVRTKTSYHSAEHGFLNYMYTNLWVSKEPVVLYFNIKKAKKGDKLYPVPIEDKEITIQKVEINLKEWEQFDPGTGSVSLPDGENIKVKVTLKAEK